MSVMYPLTYERRRCRLGRRVFTALVFVALTLCASSASFFLDEFIGVRRVTPSGPSGTWMGAIQETYSGVFVSEGCVAVGRLRISGRQVPVESMPAASSSFGLFAAASRLPVSSAGGDWLGLEGGTVAVVSGSYSVESTRIRFPIWWIIVVGIAWVAVSVLNVGRHRRRRSVVSSADR